MELVEREVRLFDSTGRFAGWLQPDEANRLIGAGRVTVQGKGRRTTLWLVSGKTVQDFLDEAKRTDHFTYAERFGGKRVVVLKRYDEASGTFRKWDNALSFDELRQGRMQSRARQLARRAAMETAKAA